MQVVFLKKTKAPYFFCLSLFSKEINHKYKGCYFLIPGLNLFGNLDPGLSSGWQKNNFLVSPVYLKIFYYY